MKKLPALILLFCLTCIRLHGQWYSKQYNVTDINQLTRQQLEESLKSSNKSIVGSLAFTGVGAGIYLIFRYLKPGMGDDPSFFEQLIGDEGVNKIGMITGAGLAAGGIISTIVYSARSGSIKSAIHRNFMSDGRIQFMPVIYAGGKYGSAYTAFSLKYRF